MYQILSNLDQPSISLNIWSVIVNRRPEMQLRTKASHCNFSLLSSSALQLERVFWMFPLSFLCVLLLSGWFVFPSSVSLWSCSFEPFFLAFWLRGCVGVCVLAALLCSAFVELPVECSPSACPFFIFFIGSLAMMVVVCLLFSAIIIFSTIFLDRKFDRDFGWVTNWE